MIKLDTEKIKRHMEKRGLTYREIAKLVGMDCSQLFKILNGQVNAGLKSLNKIAEYFEAHGVEDCITQSKKSCGQK